MIKMLQVNKKEYLSYSKTVLNIPTEELYDKNGNKVTGMFGKIEGNTLYAQGYDKVSKEINQIVF